VSVDAAPYRGVRLPGGIFWRTFFLIALLIGISLAGWFQSFRIIERTPRAQQVAQTIISVINVTRSALIYSDPTRRTELLEDLANNESIRIYPLEPTDIVRPLEASPAMQTTTIGPCSRGTASKPCRGCSGCAGARSRSDCHWSERSSSAG